MYSFLSRANAISAYALSVLACLTFFLFTSTFFVDYHTNVQIRTARTIVKSLSNNDLGHLTLDLDADLTSLFNWNVKQLFVYLYAEYGTSSNFLNQIVLWDKIIQRGEKAHLKHKNMNVKYYFWDDGAGLRRNNVTLTLAWNVIPNVGCLTHVPGHEQHIFTFPSEYTVPQHK